MRLFFYLMACLFLGSQVGGCQPVPRTSPNILLILVDDMGYSDLGCYGGEIATPNIDALAENGLRMTQLYNAARCCPSRASLLTGLYPHQAGMGHQNRDQGLPSYRGRITANAATLAEVLGPHGYTTYQVGKWHVGNPRSHWPDRKGFQHDFALIEGAMSYYNNWPWVRGQDTLAMTYNGQRYTPPANFFATDAFSDTAASFIRAHDARQPFFMYLAYNAPHWPLHAKPEDIERYKGAYAGGWDQLRTQRHARMQALGLIDEDTPLSPRFSGVPAWDDLSLTEQRAWQVNMELYAAVMHRLDLGIGRVVAALEACGHLDNTLILLLSDNGACHEDPDGPWMVYPQDGKPGSERSFPAYLLPWANASNTPYRLFKSFLHEGGIRTPFIAHLPGTVPAGHINRQTVGHIMDLMPTLLELAGASYPDSLDGRRITPSSGQSLLPALKGEAQPGHDQLFWEHQFNRAVRQGDWKLVSAYRVPEAGRRDRWELYHLAEDPVEAQDVAEQYPDKVAEMAAAYETWAREVGAYDKPTLDRLKKAQKP